MLIGMADEGIKLEIRPHNRWTADVRVNGVDISRSVSSYHVRHGLGEVPTVELELIGAATVEGPARVEIQPELRTALIALGWTAPA